jgi:hypothetical protein
VTRWVMNERLLMGDILPSVHFSFKASIDCCGGSMNLGLLISHPRHRLEVNISVTCLLYKKLEQSRVTCARALKVL